jgi:hypothetical protein
MFRKFTLVSLLFIQAQCLFSQQAKPSLRLEFQVKPSFGFNLPTSKLLKGDATDHLISYDDQSYYLQFIGLALFFDKHWGVEFNFQGNSSGRKSNRDQQFLQAMQTEYESNFYVTPSTGASNKGSNFFSGDIERGFLGVIYRLESNRFFFYPKAAIGITSFYADWGSAYLKEKNANNVVLVDYRADKIPQDHFIVAGSASFGYKFTKHLYLNVDAIFSYYKVNVSYTKTITNLNSKLSTVENINYKKGMPGVSVGAGFIVSLK